MTPKNLLTLLFSLISISQLCHAHSPTEIGFRFKEEDQKTFLEVHLTSTTLFDMMYHLKPELRSKESLNLGHYVADYEAYFNEHLDLKLNGKERYLNYVASNLIIHDASITFLIENLDEQLATYDIEIHGFDFYSNPKFTMLLTLNDFAEVHFLNKEENRCSNVPTIKASIGDRPLPLYVILAVVFGSLTVMIGIRRYFSKKVFQSAWPQP